MTFLNKTRFLLATTALVATLQAQGKDPEPTIMPSASRSLDTQILAETEDLWPGIEKKHKDMMAIGDAVFWGMAAPDNLTERNALDVFNLNFSFLVSTMDKLYDSLSDDEKAFLRDNAQARAFFQDPYGLAPILAPAWRYSSDEKKQDLYFGTLSSPSLTQYRRTCIQSMIKSNPSRGFYVTADSWRRLPEDHQNQLKDYVTHYKCIRGKPSEFLDILGKLPLLVDLDLSFNAIDDVGVAKVVEALKFTRLTNLDLSYNEIGLAGVKEIAGISAINLASLHLLGNGIGDVGAEELAKIVANNIDLTILDLGENDIGAAGAQAIAGALGNNRTLTNLNLKNNGIGDVGAEEFAKILKTDTPLTILNLTCNEISDVGGRKILEALQENEKSKLRKLNLSLNRFSDDLKNEFNALAKKRGFKMEFCNFF